MFNYDRHLKYLMIFISFSLIPVIQYGTVSAEIISLDRRIQWDPGTRSDLTLRTSIYRTINTASQGDDTNTIQNALNSCPKGQVVVLGSGMEDLTLVHIDCRNGPRVDADFASTWRRREIR